MLMRIDRQRMDCTASTLRFKPGTPVFDGQCITPQLLHPPLATFSAVLTAYVEAHHDHTAQQNRGTCARCIRRQCHPAKAMGGRLAAIRQHVALRRSVVPEVLQRIRMNHHLQLPAQRHNHRVEVLQQIVVLLGDKRAHVPGLARLQRTQFCQRPFNAPAVAQKGREANRSKGMRVTEDDKNVALFGRRSLPRVIVQVARSQVLIAELLYERAAATQLFVPDALLHLLKHRLLPTGVDMQVPVELTSQAGNH